MLPDVEFFFARCTYQNLIPAVVPSSLNVNNATTSPSVPREKAGEAGKTAFMSSLHRDETERNLVAF